MLQKIFENELGNEYDLREKHITGFGSCVSRKCGREGGCYGTADKGML